MALSPEGWLYFSGEVAQSLPEWWLYKTEIFTMLVVIEMKK